LNPTDLWPKTYDLEIDRTGARVAHTSPPVDEQQQISRTQRCRTRPSAPVDRRYVRRVGTGRYAYTFHALCAGKVDVNALQQAVATDWTTAVANLGLPPVPAGYRG